MKGAINELALFAGAGGGILGGILSGWRTVCAVEIDPFCREVLLRRQMDGCLPKFPIWDDVRTFDGKPWRERVDVVSGGFPCQDISCAGQGVGIEGERSGLWSEFARIIREVRPRFVFVENSPMLTSRGLDRVLGDLAESGYNARWGVLGASDVGAPHIRKRIWVIATDASRRVLWVESGGAAGRVGKVRPSLETMARRGRWPTPRSRDWKGGGKDCLDKAVEIWPTPTAVTNTGGAALCKWGGSGARHKLKSMVDDSQLNGALNPSWVAWLMGWPVGWESLEPLSRNEFERWLISGSVWWREEPIGIPRVAKGVTDRVNRLKALGNGQVALCAATAWEILFSTFSD